MEVKTLLAKYPDLLVARLVEGTPEDYYVKTASGELEYSDRIFQNSMANLSFNLSGGLFDTDAKGHLKFLPVKGDATKPWDGKEVSSNLYSLSECYRIFDKCFSLCFRVSVIHERTFPFYKHFDDQKERDEYALKTIKSTSMVEKSYDAHLVGLFENKNKTVLVRPRIKVHHSPTMVNYWHMTLDTYRPTDSNYVLSTEQLNSSDKKMFKSLKHDLLDHIGINVVPSYTIAENNYIKLHYRVFRYIKSLFTYCFLKKRSNSY